MIRDIKKQTNDESFNIYLSTNEIKKVFRNSSERWKKMEKKKNAQN